MDELLAAVAFEEGYRRLPYRCPAGKLTIGHGFNLDEVGLSVEESMAVLKIRLRTHLEDLHSFEWWYSLSQGQQIALANMHYVLGPGGFRTFKKMLAALEAADFEEAAFQVMDSKFGRTHRNRAARIAEGLRAG